MNRGRIIGLSVIMLALVALVSVAAPYVASLVPWKKAKRIEKVRIEIAKIPDKGALEESLKGYKAIVVRNPELRVFLLPYVKGAYLLPYPNPEKPLLTCKEFLINEQEIVCKNIPLPEKWKSEAKWDFSGKSQGKWMPDLATADFYVEGTDIVVSLEYD
jgi:hypothetical protein